MVFSSFDRTLSGAAKLGLQYSGDLAVHTAENTTAVDEDALLHRDELQGALLELGPRGRDAASAAGSETGTSAVQGVSCTQGTRVAWLDQK